MKAAQKGDLWSLEDYYKKDKYLLYEFDYVK